MPRADRIGSSDPFVVVYWAGEEVARTRTIQNSLEPRWDGTEYFAFAVPGGAWEGEGEGRSLSESKVNLRVEVYDEDKVGGVNLSRNLNLNLGAVMGGQGKGQGKGQGQGQGKGQGKGTNVKTGKGDTTKGDFLGRLTLKGDELSEWSAHKPAGAGCPLFSKEYLLDMGPDRGKKSRMREIAENKRKNMLEEMEGEGEGEAAAGGRTEITVTAISARGLAKADLFGKSDPVCILKFNGTEIGRSPVVKKTLDPVWVC